MRLIDADELWEKIYRYNDNEGARMPYGDDDSLIHKDSACFLIENAPTIEPERKTGKWELLPLSIIPPVYKCSACGRHAVWITTGCLVNRHEESYLSDFCPSCGADMRGE